MNDSAFRGTVDYYRRYRPDFPDAVYDAIVSAIGPESGDRMLDLGTGTGQIALRLADHFDEVIAVDTNEEMLAAASATAAERGIANIEWRSQRAEDVGLIETSVQLITIGNALHWMDRDHVLLRCLAMLHPRGAIAVIDMPGMWSPNMELGAEPWLTVLREVVERYLGPERRAGDGVYEVQHEPPAASLDRLGFQEVSDGSAALDLDWSVDEVVGYLYSTSFANRAILGGRADAFEADLRAALGEARPSGRFPRRLVARWAIGH